MAVHGSTAPPFGVRGPVWWPRCKLKGAKKALDKVQRMVLGGVADCMRSTPLVACEVLLGLPPLDLWIRKMAFKANYRLQSHSSRPDMCTEFGFTFISNI